MRHLAVAVLVAALAGPALAGPEDGPAIEAVISDQVADFRAGDLSGAFDHASATIRAIFGTPDSFGQMVRSQYPMIWNPSQLRFLALRSEAGALFQRVMVQDQTGRLFLFDYKMERGPEGWRIDGVFPVAGDVGA